MPSSSKSSSYTKWGVTGLLLTALLIRIIYIWQAAGEAWFTSPGMDPEYYTEWAKAILRGQGVDYLPFPRAPLYSYLLAGLMRVFGEGWIIPRIWNLIMELVSTWLVYLISLKLFDRRSAFIAGSLYAFCGAAIYFSGEILMTSTATMLLCLFTFCVIKLKNNPVVTWSLIGGLVLGLLSLLRPNALLLVPVVAWILFKQAGAEKTTRIRTVLSSSALVMITILTLLPVTAANYRATKAYIPISTQGGVNFYIGNATSASGWSSTLPKGGAMWTNDDAIALAEEHAGRKLSPWNVSSEFVNLTFEEIQRNTGAWLKLTGKKILLLVSIREIGNNRPFDLATSAVPFMHFLLFLSLGTFFPLVVIGSLHQLENSSVKIVLTILITYSISILVFFINTRYRTPLIPLAAVLSGGGVGWLLRNGFKNRRTVAILIAGYLLAIPYLFSSEFDAKAQSRLVAGNAWLRTGSYEKAIEEYEAGLTIDPKFYNLNLNLGVARMALRDTIRAESAFQRELVNNPANADACNNLGITLEQRSAYEDASIAYRRAIEINPLHTNARINLKRIYLKTTDLYIRENSLMDADSVLATATAEFPSDADLFFRMALLQAARNNYSETQRLLLKTLELDSSYQKAHWLLGQLEDKLKE